MSVIAKTLESKMKLVVNITKDGKTATKSKTYSNVKASAEDSSVYNTAKSLADLQTHPLNRITRVEEKELEETV